MSPGRIIITAVVSSLAFTSTVVAQDEESPQAKFEKYQQVRRELHEQRVRYLAEERTAKLMRVRPETRRFECRIESLLDGTIMISKAYDPEIEPVLMKFGHRKVQQPPEHIGRQLYNGRSYQLFNLREDIPEWKVNKYLGRAVELELEILEHSGMPRVVRIRELRERGPSR
jgi:hypothetical protein